MRGTHAKAIICRKASVNSLGLPYSAAHIEKKDEEHDQAGG
jgi:hypothetical protein